MTTTLDVSDDYTLWDNYEAGTFRRQGSLSRSDAGVQAETLPTDVSITRALRSLVTSKEVEHSRGTEVGGRGRLRSDDVRWRIAVAELAAEPVSGDRFIVGTETWRVLWAEKVAWETSWRIYSRK